MSDLQCCERRSAEISRSRTKDLRVRPMFTFTIHFTIHHQSNFDIGIGNHLLGLGLRFGPPKCQAKLLTLQHFTEDISHIPKCEIIYHFRQLLWISLLLFRHILVRSNISYIINT